MKFKEVLIKAMRISLIPSIEWKAIKDEQETPKELMWNFGFPIILFSAIGHTFGFFFEKKPYFGLSFELLFLLVFNLISWVLIPYFLLLLAAFVLYFTLPKLGIETDYLRILKLVVYTFTPLFIVTFFVYFHPLLLSLIPIGIYIFIAYTLYIFWYGVQELFDITVEKKLRFILITVAVGFATIFLIQHIYSMFMEWIIKLIVKFI